MFLMYLALFKAFSIEAIIHSRHNHIGGGELHVVTAALGQADENVAANQRQTAAHIHTRQCV